MADFAGIAAAGKSIERVLNAAFDEEEPIPNQKTRAVLVQTGDFEENQAAINIGSPALSVFVYRVDFNKTMRAAWSAVGTQNGNSHLAVDLHFLISAWAGNAEHEHRIIGKAMQSLEATPVLGGPLLHPSSNWAPNETIQVVLEDLSTEAVMRIFDSLPTDYRLSVPYIARCVRIDGRLPSPEVPSMTVVTGTTPTTKK